MTIQSDMIAHGEIFIFMFTIHAVRFEYLCAILVHRFNVLYVNRVTQSLFPLTSMPHHRWAVSTSNIDKIQAKTTKEINQNDNMIPKGFKQKHLISGIEV